MDKNESVQEFTVQENKTISKASFIMYMYLTFQSSYIMLENLSNKVGEYILYLFTSVIFIAVAMMIAYLFLFCKSLWKIRKYRMRYSIIAIMLISMAMGLVDLGYDYVVDIFQGTEMVTTNEYSISGMNGVFIRFIDNKGEVVRMHLSDEIVNRIADNPYIDENPRSDNSLFYHKNNITIAYYSNSRVLSSVTIDSCSTE